jgi:hypothetical protein
VHENKIANYMANFVLQELPDEVTDGKATLLRLFVEAFSANRAAKTRK